MTDPDGDPTEAVVAYCAPGLKSYAERLLESNGVRVREVVEHPYMAGRTDVMLVAGPGSLRDLCRRVEAPEMTPEEYEQAIREQWESEGCL